jgi:glucose-1-phosphate cytidylyltransferase
LARNGELSAFKHNGFWQCMDTLRDKIYLNDLWEKNKAPWKMW